MKAVLDAAEPDAHVTRRWARKLLDHIATATLVVAGASIVGMACVEGWQVFARYVLNRSPSWTEPVALLLMSTAMMLELLSASAHAATSGSSF